MNQKLPDCNCYCFNPGCLEPQNLVGTPFCRSCGSSLLLANRYCAIRLLGHGKFSRTFLAFDQAQTPSTLCVVKCVVKQSWGGATHFYASHPLQMLFQLTQQEKLGQHLQIPQFLDQFEQEGVLYLVQEYIPGENLASVLAQKGTFSASEVWQILVSLLPVIQQIHDCGVIHGDIKPENIICRVPLDHSSTRGALADLVLVDIGVANLLTEMAVVQSEAIGSPAYAATEQLKGKPVFASDLYSLGVTCIHLLTGMHPFSLFDFGDPAWAWRNNGLPDPANAQDGLEHRQLGQLLDRLIQPALHQRVGSVEETMTEIQKLRSKQKIVPVSMLVREAKRSPPWKCDATLVGHSGLFANVNAIAIAPDSKMLASASDDQTIRLWDMQTGEERFTLHGHTHFVKSVAFHPQAQTILASGSRDRTVKLWNLQTRSVIQTLTGHEQSINAVLFSPDGNLLASGSSDKRVNLWDSQTSEIIASLKGHALAITALAFSPLSLNGNQPILASASADATVRLWDLTTFERVHTLIGHTAAVKAVAFSPDGRWLATGGEDRTIRLWDVEFRQCIRTLSGHPWTVSALTFSPDGKTLISGSWDKTVKLWQVSTGNEAGTLGGHTDSVSCVAIAPHQRIIVSGSNDRTIKLWSCNELDA